MSQAKYQPVVAAVEVPLGTLRHIVVDGNDLVICHTQEGFFAVDNVCTHADANLHEGRLRGARLICPLHGASFDCRTGAVLGPPAVQPLRTYPVRVNGTHLEVEI